jgi:hypothetical protein
MFDVHSLITRIALKSFSYLNPLSVVSELCLVIMPLMPEKRSYANSCARTVSLHTFDWNVRPLPLPSDCAAYRNNQDLISERTVPGRFCLHPPSIYLLHPDPLSRALTTHESRQFCGGSQAFRSQNSRRPCCSTARPNTPSI